MAKKTSKKRAKGLLQSEPSTHRNGPVPAVYQEMLAEAETSLPSKLGDDERAVKRRRVGGRLTGGNNAKTEGRKGSESAHGQTDTDLHKSPSSKHLQTIELESGFSSDSDAAWEEVNLEGRSELDLPDDDGDAGDGSIDLVLDMEAKPTSRKPTRRKPVSAEARKVRLVIHKVHLLCLLHHVYLRNHWCNDGRVQKSLRKLLSKDLISYLHPSEDKSQFQRDRSFTEGLKQASDVFRSKFQPTTRGMRSAQWAEDGIDQASVTVPRDIDLPIGRSDFRELATKMQGSRDVGEQLFCAMLRSAGVDARLVCSMQPLPFTSSTAASMPQRPERHYLEAEEESDAAMSDEEGHSNTVEEPSLPIVPAVTYGGNAVRIRSKLAARLGRPPPANVAPPPVHPEPKVENPPLIRESLFPIYWVEAFNSAVQKWVSVDPITTRTIAQPSKLCPPASDSSNRLSYVLAFEEDYRVRDVTLRYSQAFNAKTRKLRVEETKGGKQWLERILHYYGSSNHELDRDQVEDAELKAKEAREPMPRNVIDFKNHPYFALERHIKRGEVIHPKRQVGKVNVGKSAEIVYRRRDVHIVKSADNWYRLGRDIKVGEQPLKRARPHRRLEEASDEDESLDNEGAGTALYAPFQTQAYIAPPVFNGQVPKNAFGNIDVYVPSMVPPGGIHLTHPDTSHAARILGIDYSDAVTGFEFRGRHGTAIVKGAVIAEEFREAVITVLTGLEDERRQEEEARRTLEALRTWKRLLTGLKIRQRIDGYEIEGERGDQSDNAKEEASYNEQSEQDESYVSEYEDMAGGFMPASSIGPIAEPTASRHLPGRTPEYQYDHRIASPLDRHAGLDDPSGGQNDNITSKVVAHQLPLQLQSEGGGFIVDSEDVDEVFLSTTKATSPKADQGSTLPGGYEHETPRHLQDGERNPFIPADPSSPQSNPVEISSLLDKEELEDARILQRLYEAEQSQPNPPRSKSSKHSTMHLDQKFQPATGLGTFETALDESAETDPRTKHPPILQSRISQSSENPIPEYAEKVGNEQQRRQTRSSSLESKGSLLSFDPDDVDAEPDWLD